jgi:hypothetical protein
MDQKITNRQHNRGPLPGFGIGTCGSDKLQMIRSAGQRIPGSHKVPAIRPTGVPVYRHSIRNRKKSDPWEYVCFRGAGQGFN